MAANEVSTAASPVPDRIMSVDALRGFDMFWITGGQGILVSFLSLFFHPIPPAIRTQLSHKAWEGFAAWDLIMPLFLFIVGVAMPFSFSKYTNPLRPEYQQNRSKLYIKIARRFVILFILGMIAQGNLLSFNMDKLHLYSNTLQAIACGYVIAAVLLLNVSKSVQLIATGVLLYAFWLLMMLVPVPGQGAGHLEPRLNLAIFVDETILRRFRDGTDYTWILSSLTFAGSVLLGVMAGHMLRSDRTKWEKVGLLFGAGLLCLAVGWMWSLWFPIIKHIWTSSMVLWAAGWSYLLLAVFYLVIDVLGYRKWTFFFTVIGANAIVAYMAGEAFEVGHLLAKGIGFVPFGPLREFVPALLGFGVFWLGLYVLYRKKIFIRVG